MKKDLIIEIKNTYVTAQTALTKILKLREICSGFGIGEDRKILELGENPKLRELLTLLEEIGNQQAIIWTNFVYETEKIQSVLGDKAISIYGKTIDKYQCINDFKQGRYQYLIANMQSLAHGITLTNCSIQIFFSLSYSYEQYIQSRGRTHRISQENKCTYIHLLCKDSIDEVVYKVLQKKGKAIEILENILTR